MTDNSKKCSHGKIVVPGSVLPNGNRIGIYHDENCNIYPGEIISVREGQPLSNDKRLLLLEKDNPESSVLRVIGEIPEKHATSPEETSSGKPAMYNNRLFLNNWDQTFRKNPASMN
jgi:hypothetical protein